MASRDQYIPLCPVCRYDVTGLPDGRCPECGNRFTHARIRALYEARRRRRPPGHEAMTGALILALPPICLIPGVILQLIAVPLMWLLAIVWVRQHRDNLQGEYGYWILWLLIPCIRTPIGLEKTILHLPMTIIAATAAAVVLQHAFRRSPRQSATILLGVIALATIPTGLFAAVSGGAGSRAQHYWGAWDVPRMFPKLPFMGPSHVRAMTNTGMLRLGLYSLSIGALAATAAAVIGWRWLKEANQPPPRRPVNPQARRHALDHLEP